MRQRHRRAERAQDDADQDRAGAQILQVHGLELEEHAFPDSPQEKRSLPAKAVNDSCLDFVVPCDLASVPAVAAGSSIMATRSYRCRDSTGAQIISE